MISRQEIEERWRAGETLDAIASTFAGGEQRKRPVSRQAISKRLIRMGFSPRERRYQVQAAEGSEASADRLDHLSRRADERAAARVRLQELAAETGYTLRQLATPVLLPQDVRERAEAAAEPYSVSYLAHVSPSPG